MAKRAMVAALWMAATTGCAGAIAGDMAEAVPEPLINETLRTAMDPDTRELATDVAALPEIEEATATLVARVTDGALHALGEEERAERLAEAVDGFVREVGRALAEEVGREIAPALGRSVAEGLERSLVRLTAERNQPRLAALAATLARAGAEQLARGVSDALRDPEVQLILGATAQNVGRNLAIGAGEAIDEIEARERDRRTGPPLESGAATGDAEADVPWAALAVVVLAALLIAVFVSSRRTIRRRDRALSALARAIAHAEDDPGADALRRSLRRSLRDDPDADALRALLGPSDEPPDPRRRLDAAEAT